jgi:hypothetical protein
MLIEIDEEGLADITMQAETLSSLADMIIEKLDEEEEESNEA